MYEQTFQAGVMSDQQRLRVRGLLVLVTMLLAGAGVLRLAAWVSASPVTAVDLPISLFVQRVFAPWGGLMETISILGFAPMSQIYIVAVGAALWALGLRRAAVVSLLVLPNAVISLLAKMWVDRPRPTDDLVTVVLHLDDGSFPSGHVIMYTAVFGFLIVVMLLNRRLPPVVRGVVLIVSAGMLLTVGISRMYLGAHWITDVLGGHLIGLSILSLLILLYGSQQIFPRLVDNVKTADQPD